MRDANAVKQRLPLTLSYERPKNKHDRTTDRAHTNKQKCTHTPRRAAVTERVSADINHETPGQ